MKYISSPVSHFHKTPQWLPIATGINSKLFVNHPFLPLQTHNPTFHFTESLQQPLAENVTSGLHELLNAHPSLAFPPPLTWLKTPSEFNLSGISFRKPSLPSPRHPQAREDTPSLCCLYTLCKPR